MIADAAGVRAEVTAITSAAMRGELDFAGSLAARLAMLEGLDTRVLDEVRAWVRVTRGVPELVRAVRAVGGRVAAVSGGFHEVLDPIADALGLDAWRANRLGVADGRLTGRSQGPVIDAAGKRDALLEWAARFEIPWAQTVAVGDGANDLLMMASAGLSVGFRPKPAVRAAADVLLDEPDLSLLLPLLGLRSDRPAGKP